MKSHPRIRHNQDQPTFLEPTHRRLDTLARTFTPNKLGAKEVASTLQPSAKKALFFWQLHELTVLAPSAVDVTKLRNKLDKLMGMQIDYRGAYVGQDVSQGWFRDVDKTSYDLIEAIRGEMIHLRDRHEHLQINAHAIAEAGGRQSNQPEALEAFPHVKSLVERAKQPGLMQRLTDQLTHLSLLYPHVYKGRLSDIRQRFNHDVKEAVDEYYAKGGDLKARDPIMYARVQEMYKHPQNGHPLWELSRDLGKNFMAETHWRAQLIDAYKKDRRDILNRPAADSVDDPLQQSSPVLDLVYAARWQVLLDFLNAKAWDQRRLISNPNIVSDSTSHALVQFMREAGRKGNGAGRA